jgi:hypothetical protein
MRARSILLIPMAARAANGPAIRSGASLISYFFWVARATSTLRVEFDVAMG